MKKKTYPRRNDGDWNFHWYGSVFWHTTATDKGLGDGGDRRRWVTVEIGTAGPDHDFHRWVRGEVWKNNRGKMMRKSQHKNKDKPS